MSANLEVIEMWRGEEVLEEIMEGVDYGLAYAAMDMVIIDKAFTSVDKGNLKRSKRTAPPGYTSDDFAASQAGDLALDDVEMVKRQVVDHQIAEGSWLPYAYLREMGTSKMNGDHATATAGEIVSRDMDKYVRQGLEHTQRTI
jgi:hypothetical protein